MTNFLGSVDQVARAMAQQALGNPLNAVAASKTAVPAATASGYQSDGLHPTSTLAAPIGSRAIASVIARYANLVGPLA